MSAAVVVMGIGIALVLALLGATSHSRSSGSCAARRSSTG